MEIQSLAPRCIRAQGGGGKRRIRKFIKQKCRTHLGNCVRTRRSTPQREERGRTFSSCRTQGNVGNSGNCQRPPATSTMPRSTLKRSTRTTAVTYDDSLDERIKVTCQTGSWKPPTLCPAAFTRAAAICDSPIAVAPMGADRPSRGAGHVAVRRTRRAILSHVSY